MKINELIHPRKYGLDSLTHTRFSIEKLLKPHGFIPIGKGSAYANVFKHDNLSYILKVFSTYDTGYLKFLKIVEKNKNNPHFPKFRGKLIKLSENAIAIRMEKLTPLDSKINLFHKVDRHLYNWRKFLDSRDEKLLEKFPQLEDAIEILIENQSRKAVIDLHSKNVMQRGDCPVIIDPYSPDAVY